MSNAAVLKALVRTLEKSAINDKKSIIELVREIAARTEAGYYDDRCTGGKVIHVDFTTDNGGKGQRHECGSFKGDPNSCK